MKNDALKKSAEQGDVSSQFLLAGYYYGTEDYTAAAKWYTESAQQGHLEAQFLLGMLYLFKIQDFDQGIHWLCMASAQGHAEATEELEKLVSLSN